MSVKNYHANNGQFVDNLFIATCQSQGQGIAYCGLMPIIKMALQRNEFESYKKSQDPCYCTQQIS